MKKQIFFITCLLSLSTTKAQVEEIYEWKTPGHYVIESDVISMDVPEGKCLVIGKVMGPVRDTASPQPVQGGSILTADGSKRSTTNERGNYQLLLDEADSLLYFYTDGLTEIEVRNFDFKSQHKVTINFFPWFAYQVTVVDKPVIYLYSENNRDADVTFSCVGELTFTYPHFDGNWEVAVKGNTITDRNTGKEYPYLFWESQTENMTFETSSNGLEGFVIDTDTAVSFLENSLAALGLTSTEQTDFITYWGPKLIQSKYVFIQFWVDDAYAENISHMTITPAPDALRRVFMAYAPLETTVLPGPVIPQKLKSFERKSFTVVEWGGSELQAPLLTP